MGILFDNPILLVAAILICLIFLKNVVGKVLGAIFGLLALIRLLTFLNWL